MSQITKDIIRVFIERKRAKTREVLRKKQEEAEKEDKNKNIESIKEMVADISLKYTAFRDSFISLCESIKKEENIEVKNFLDDDLTANIKEVKSFENFMFDFVMTSVELTIKHSKESNELYEEWDKLFVYIKQEDNLDSILTYLTSLGFDTTEITDVSKQIIINSSKLGIK